MMVLGWIVAFGGLIILRIIYSIILSQRKKKAGFVYVYVNEDGSVRKLIPKEIKYLSQKFEPNSPDIPYLKHKYKSLSDDGKLAGFIHIKKVPLWVKIS